MKINVTTRLDIASAIIILAEKERAYTYNQLRDLVQGYFEGINISAGLISSIIFHYMGKFVELTVEDFGREEWQFRTYITIIS